MDNLNENDSGFEGYAILELMGHRRIIGYLREQELAGHSYLRIDVADPPSTQFYSPAAVYCITPTTEEMALQAAKLNHVTPVNRWELPPARDQFDYETDADEGP